MHRMVQKSSLENASQFKRAVFEVFHFEHQALVSTYFPQRCRMFPNFELSRSFVNRSDKKLEEHSYALLRVVKK